MSPIRHLPAKSRIRCHNHPSMRATVVVKGELTHRKHVCTVYALLCPTCLMEVERASA